MTSGHGRPFPEWVPPDVVAAYLEKNISCLFDWQSDVLQLAEAHDGNVVYSAPTSAGKSIVAELIALRLALTGKKVLFLLPYISMAKERMHFLQRAWRRIDIQVAAFMGAQSSPSREWTAAVCTTEKANSLLNHAVLDGRMEEIGLVVIDELHMVYDSSRGAVLESLCAKINIWNSRKPNSAIRIIGMSATLDNLTEVGSWLRAKVIETQFRPVELHERICCDGQISDLKTGVAIRSVAKRFRLKDDPHCVVGLAAEGIFFRKLVLVFCSSKSDVEKVALDLAKVLDGIYRSNQVIASRVNRSGLRRVQENLMRSAGSLDTVLAKTLPRGVAFHHAGLTAEERECIEDGFRSGVILVLIATSTLSSGVNLPAGRVVIKAQIRGPAAINATSYKQMSGRSGRLGEVEIGESVLAVRKNELKELLRLIHNVPQDSSQSMRDHTKLLLECICDGIATTTEELEEAMQFTLFKSQKSVEEILSYLKSNRFVVVEGQNDALSVSPTQLGRAALVSALPPDAALFVFADLQQATKAVALDTELHMLYLVTPTNCTVWQGCDWNHLQNIFLKLLPGEKRVAKLVGANNAFIVSRVRGSSISTFDRNYQLHLRFFSALALFDIINEKSIEDVASYFKISRGTLQTLQQQSATYAAMVVSFCSHLGWTYLRDLLRGFATRLAFGVRRELTELVSIEGIDASRARIFHDHDITSMVELSNCTVKKIADLLSLAVPFSSINSSDGLNEWLFGEPRMRLIEAANLLKERANRTVEEHLRLIGLSVDSLGLKLLPQLHEDFHPSKEVITEAEFANTAEPLVSEESLCAHSSDIRCEQNGHISDLSHKSEKCKIENVTTYEQDDESIDLFTDSMEELAIGDRDTENNPDGGFNSDENMDNDEIDDLEESLLKVSLICDDENQPLQPTEPVPPFKHVFDKVDVEIKCKGFSYFKEDPTLSPLQKRDINLVNQHPMKRTRRQVVTVSPSISSPVGKNSRFEQHLNNLSMSELNINDTCRSESAWNYFVQWSSLWKKVAVAIVKKRHCAVEQNSLEGICFCTPDGSPYYIPIGGEYFPGNEIEEAICPSSTPSQLISLDERIACISSILQSCELYFVEALRDYRVLKSFTLDNHQITCISHLAFLAHLRDGDSVLPLSEIASKFEWNFDYCKLLRMNPRISAGTQSFLASRLVGILSLLVSDCSSVESLHLEIRSLRAVNRMCMHGLYFDHELCSFLLQKLRKELERLELECFELVGKNFNLDSSVQVSEVLFSELKLIYPGGSSTKKHLSTNKAILEKMIAYHPIVEKILNYRRIKHTITQVLIPLQRCVENDGKVRTHCQMNTATGRILCFEPNIQNISKDELVDRIGPRHLFKAEPGCVLISADYSQLELRVLAHLSGDPDLIAIFEDGKDVFSDMSANLSVPRDIVKKLCYGVIYGMGAKSLAECLRKTSVEANELILQFFRSFPKVKSYINNTKEEAVTCGFVRTVLGRRRVTCNVRGRQEDVARDDRQSINYTIQGTASEIFKRAVVALDKPFRGLTKIVLLMHDEIVVECAAEYENDVKQWMRSIMEEVFPDFSVPLRVKIRSGLNWGSLK